MSDTNAFTQMAMAGAKPPMQRPMQHPEPRGRTKQPAKQDRAPQPKVNPATAVSGVPKPVAAHPERQLDGSRTQQFSRPVRKGGLAERQSSPAPHANSRDARSGLEGAMAGLADQLHPRGRPKSTQRRK